MGGTNAYGANGDSTIGHGYNAGDVKVYTLSAPATANAAETGTVLIDWVLPNPAFGAATAALPSVLPLNTTSSVAAAATGTAVYGRILANGDTGALSTTQRRGQFDVGTSGANMTMNTTSIVSGAIASLTALSVSGS